jgi:hypothetical protein
MLTPGQGLTTVEEGEREFSMSREEKENSYSKHDRELSISNIDNVEEEHQDDEPQEDKGLILPYTLLSNAC